MLQKKVKSIFISENSFDKRGLTRRFVQKKDKFRREPLYVFLIFVVIYFITRVD